MKDFLYIDPSDRVGKVWETERKIRDYFVRETQEMLHMEIEGMIFSLVHIYPDVKENIRKFEPYHYGSVVWKYWVEWKAGCLEDRYVFDTREHAVEFIIMSMRMEHGE